MAQLQYHWIRRAFLFVLLILDAPQCIQAVYHEYHKKTMTLQHLLPTVIICRPLAKETAALCTSHNVRTVLCRNVNEAHAELKKQIGSIQIVREDEQ
ncbi:hypothetical protein J3R30DRAFT_3427647 [Lentinula aciculospora]|uniref:Uncharacterized protein n=1 Tax=Lentinula aciculospora TaxID=153920 RepID=A0A9W9AUM1_9AGAR|nr:hypothetical protein J3R30DRAFT_3427647 [Lentinula aciculospora]